MRTRRKYICVAVIIAVAFFAVNYTFGPTQVEKSVSNIAEEQCVVYILPYVKIDLKDEPYRVLRRTEGCHEGDILIDCQYDELHHMYRVSPTGDTVNMFSFDWSWSSARLLENGNYLLGDLDKRIIELDQEGNIVWELDMLGISHQVVPLPNSNLLVCSCHSDSFREIKRSGEVVFEWYAEDHMKHYDPTNFKGLELIGTHTLSNPLAATKLGWTHLNFVQKLPNGNYIVSLRNLDLVVEVDGVSGEIVWSYGPGIIKYQHTPVVYENYMYIFDNGNGRIIKVNRDTGRIVMEIRGILAPAFGDVRRLPNGNLLITDSFHNRAIEVDESTGKIVWEIQACSALYRVWCEGTW